MSLEFLVASEVRAALAEGAPVVALESTIISHGLPRPDNRRVADEIEDSVRSAGAVPATIAVLDGLVHIGLESQALDRLAEDPDIVKASTRDLGLLSVRRQSGSTTVAATAHLANLAGIRVFATGGLGGVHHTPFDESADLFTLASTPIVIVCAGVKSILDVGATLERLETLGIPVIGIGTDRFPGFYLRDSGFGVPARTDDPVEISRLLRAREALELAGAIIAAVPIAPEFALDPEQHDAVVAEALTAATAAGVSGKDVTPFLLARLHAATNGETLRANIALVLANATVAADIARAYAAAE